MRSLRPASGAIVDMLGKGGIAQDVPYHIGAPDGGEGDYPGTQTSVGAAVQDLVTQLSTRLHAEADALIAGAQRRSDAVLAKRAAVIEQQRGQITDLEKQLADASAQLEKAFAGYAKARHHAQAHELSVAQLSERIEGLNERIRERDARVKALEEQWQGAGRALEHDHSVTTEQRRQDQRRHEQEIHDMQMALRHAEDALRARDEQSVKLNRDNVRLATQLDTLEKANQQAHRECEELRIAGREVQPLRRQRDQLREQLDRAMQQNEQLRVELAGAHSAAEKERALRTIGEMDVMRMRGRLDTLKEMLAELQGDDAGPDADTGS
ncbi:MAG: hypothetical protein ACREPF_08575 [Rhodanobacteraceae bacterium]